MEKIIARKISIGPKALPYLRSIQCYRRLISPFHAEKKKAIKRFSTTRELEKIYKSHTPHSFMASFNWWFLLVAIPYVEFIGYVFHRFLDHSHLIPRIEYEHWKHHFKLYPPKNLRPDHPYVKVKAIEYKTFGPLALALPFVVLSFENALPMALGSGLYAILFWYFHRLFHLRKHILSKKKYFLYLQKIHDNHHINTTKNYTITNPIMDFIFGTYAHKTPKYKNTFANFEKQFEQEVKSGKFTGSVHKTKTGT